jgi:hypothetical protein
MESVPCSGKQFAASVVWFFVIAGLGLAGNTYKSHFLAGASAVAFGLLVAWWEREILRTGVERTNWGTYYRDRNPLGFWISVAIGVVLSLFLLGAGVAVMLHIVTPANW